MYVWERLVRPNSGWFVLHGSELYQCATTQLCSCRAKLVLVNNIHLMCQIWSAQHKKNWLKWVEISTCNFDTKYPNLHYITLWSPKICDFTYLKVPKNTLLLIIRVSVNVNTILCGHFAQYLLVIIWVSELKIWLIEGLIRPFKLDKTTQNVLISILCLNFADFDSLKYQVLILFDFFSISPWFFCKSWYDSVTSST